MSKEQKAQVSDTTKMSEEQMLKQQIKISVDQ
jgi:hypothetical protein